MLEGCQDRSPRDAVSQMSKPTLLAITDGENKASISDKLRDHSDHMLTWEKSKLLAGETAVSEIVISRCQAEKNDISFFLASKESLMFCVIKTN